MNIFLFVTKLSICLYGINQNILIIRVLRENIIYCKISVVSNKLTTSVYIFMYIAVQTLNTLYSVTFNLLLYAYTYILVCRPIFVYMFKIKIVNRFSLFLYREL